MNFDPTHYAPKGDMQAEPFLPDDAWIARFVAYMKTEGEKQANDKFRPEVESYAKQVAPSYLADRKSYRDPEEAAFTDLSYWEDEE